MFLIQSSESVSFLGLNIIVIAIVVLIIFIFFVMLIRKRWKAGFLHKVDTKEKKT